MPSLISIRQIDLDLLTQIAEMSISLEKKDSSKNVERKSNASKDPKVIATVFFEDSTRTKSAFSLAIKDLNWTELSLAVDKSSLKKDESHEDTYLTLMQSGAQGFVIRHPESGYPELASKWTGLPVINAGDGCNEHPTQAISDLLCILNDLNIKDVTKADLRGLKIAIVGDIAHSRVARSDVWIFQKFGCDIRLAGPGSLIPHNIGGVEVIADLLEAIKDCDYIIALRLQKERIKQNIIPSPNDYAASWRISPETLDQVAHNAKLMHPGPVNRDLEITADLLYSERSLIGSQVYWGRYARLAALKFALEGIK